MIVYTKDDTVKLSGALTRNQWPTIKAAARVLMKDHPEGILIDAGELTTVTPEGARTFLDALKDIEGIGARMVVCNLPAPVIELVKKVPGLRSQLAFSMSVDEARESLRAGSMCSVSLPPGAIIVPVLETCDTDTALRLAAAAQREAGQPVGLVAFLTVPRDLPLSSPLPEEEAAAQALIAEAATHARLRGLRCAVHIERVRDLRDGLLHTLASHQAAMVVLALRHDHLRDEDFLELSDLLLRKAPCEVLVARVSAGNGGGTVQKDAFGKEAHGERDSAGASVAR